MAGGLTGEKAKESKYKLGGISVRAKGGDSQAWTGDMEAKNEQRAT